MKIERKHYYFGEGYSFYPTYDAMMDGIAKNSGYIKGLQSPDFTVLWNPKREFTVNVYLAPDVEQLTSDQIKTLVFFYSMYGIERMVIRSFGEVC